MTEREAADGYMRDVGPYHERSVGEAVRRAIREAYLNGYRRGQQEAESNGAVITANEWGDRVNENLPPGRWQLGRD